MTLAFTIATFALATMLATERVVQLLRARPRGRSNLTGMRIIVQTDAGHSIRGIVSRDLDDALVLEHAEYLQGNVASPVGLVTVPRAQIAFTQAAGDQVTANEPRKIARAA